MARINFFRGQGTGNDFIIVDDQHGMHDPEPELVARMCDRHFGIGGDGLLRVVRARHVNDWDGEPDLWFMDYRNADGTVAETCGNGLRVFARYLVNEHLVPDHDFTVATRAGLRHIEVGRSGAVTAAMGPVGVAGEPVLIQVADRSWEATPVDVGNPHAVVVLDSGELAALDLRSAPQWEPAEQFPEGVNVGFLAEEGPGQLRLRVYERGVGETLSCGSGAVAAALVHQLRYPQLDCPILVAVPGGELSVELKNEQAWLSGPAQVTMRGEFWY